MLHRYREVTGSNPLKSCLFQASIRNCLNCVRNCDDHSLLDIPETGTNETITLGAASTSLDEMPSTEKDLNETLKQLRLLENKCADLEKAVSELEDKNQALQSSVFSLSRFTSDEAMLVYTGFPNYKVFLASFEYLDPGDNGENVKYWLSCDNDQNIMRLQHN